MRSLPISVCLAITTAISPALSGGLVMNEYNAVGSTKWLNAGSATVDGTGGAAEDLTFGRVLGNGNNWIELVVTQDHLDIRGWKLRWAENLKFTSTGQDLWYGDGFVNQGIITFSSDARWSDLRAGTILTVIEFQASGQASPGYDTDFTFDPCNGDWWINVHTMANSGLISTVTNVSGDGPGNFSVGNDGWLLQVVNAAGEVVTPACGEGAFGYQGGGVASTETGRLEGDPSQVSDSSMYDDADSSSFGRPNSWGDPVNIECKASQDLSALRAVALAECTACVPVFLNEYNAVSSSSYLNGGTATTDANGGAAADAFFGRALGNGGNWFELVVAVDDFDMRGLRLEWSENKTGGYSGVIQLRSDVAALASVPAGTIVTFIERNAAAGGVDTDLSADPSGGDRWMNIYTRDTAVVAVGTSTKPATTFGSITTSNDRWQVTIKDASGAVIAGPFGEGSLGYWRGAVSSTDVCRLEENPTGRIVGCSMFDDTGRFSTFGAPNTWADCPDDGTVHVQDFSGVPACVSACFGDLDGSNEVDQGDVAFALLDYGPCPGCTSDLDGSGDIDFGDVALILLSTGPCS
jgi:hypothetical protein